MEPALEKGIKTQEGGTSVIKEMVMMKVMLGLNVRQWSEKKSRVNVIGVGQ